MYSKIVTVRTDLRVYCADSVKRMIKKQGKNRLYALRQSIAYVKINIGVSAIDRAWKEQVT